MAGYLIAALVNLALAIAVPIESRGRVAYAFSFLAACAGIWSLELFFLAWMKDPVLLSPLFHVTRVGMFFIAPALLTFVTLITRTAPGPVLKAMLAASYLTSATISTLNLTLFPSPLLLDGARYLPAVDSITIAHQLNFILSGLASIVVGAAAYRTAIFREKLRIKWLTIGTLLGIVLGVASFNFSTLFAGSIGGILCLLCYAYAVTRHHMVNVNVAFRNGTIRCLAALTLISLYGVFDNALTRLGLYGDGYLYAQLLLLFPILELYGRLVTGLTHLRDRYSRSQNYNFDFARDRLLRALKNCTSVKAFRLLSDDLFLRLVRVKGFSLYLVSNPSGSRLESLQAHDPATLNRTETVAPLEGAFLTMLMERTETLFYDEANPAFKGDFSRLKASAFVPIQLAGRTVGFFMLGAPLKPEQFSYDDIRLLNWFGTEVGPVLDTLMALCRLESSLLEAEKTLSVVSRLNEYNHDIKTPFANIEALLLAGDAFSVEERQARILDQVRRGHALVATMTGLLKGRQQRIQTAVNLNGVIERVVATFPTKAKLVQLDLQPLPLMAGYEDEIELLLSNLLANAFSAQDKARHEVRIWTWFDEDEGRIGCSIQDNGCGMAPDRLATLWQGGESSRRAEGGTGVGMTVIRRIVESHDGTIVADSEAGMGTRFTLSLPIQAGQGHGANISAKVVSGRP